ncbi:MAG: hypothetical protein ABI232_05320 [Jatrophihabitantaceae bacterium]
MIGKIAVAGVTAAIIAGTGTAAVALSGDTSTAPTTPASSSKSAAHSRLDRLAKHTLHGQFVTKGKAGTFITHDLIRGTVAAVSATSIKVTAADTTSETYAVTASTKVRIRANGKGTPGTIAGVQTGDNVLVLGTGSGTATATLVVDAGH